MCVLEARIVGVFHSVTLIGFLEFLQTLILIGLVWFGLIWFGLVWFGLVFRKPSRKFVSIFLFSGFASFSEACISFVLKHLDICGVAKTNLEGNLLYCHSFYLLRLIKKIYLFKGLAVKKKILFSDFISCHLLMNAPAVQKIYSSSKQLRMNEHKVSFYLVYNMIRLVRC